LAGGDLGLGLLLGRDRVDVLLLADRVGLDQRLVARRLGARLQQVGLGARQRGPGAGQRGAVGCRVDLEQRLAGLHVAALAEQPALQDAGGARAHLGDAKGLGAPGQLGLQRGGPRRGGDDADLGGRGRCRRRCAGSAAASQRRQPRERQRRPCGPRPPRPPCRHDAPFAQVRSISGYYTYMRVCMQNGS